MDTQKRVGVGSLVAVLLYLVCTADWPGHFSSDSAGHARQIMPRTYHKARFLSEASETEAREGATTCASDTGGTCRLSDCNYWRGPTECSGFWRKCICKPGYCAKNGACTLAVSNLKAEVAPVNEGHSTFPGMQGMVSKAITFSGGGARSQTMVMGQLRALENMGVMSSVDAISSVSGGTWASAIYMFAKRNVNELLGSPTEPSKLSPSVLKQTPADIGATATTNFNMIGLKTLLAGAPWDKLWEYTIAKALLKPFGLDSLDVFMAPNATIVSKIKAENPSLEHSSFVTPQVGRPRTFVMNGAILCPPGYVATGESIVSLQMSPDFTGSPFYPNGTRVSYAAASKSGSPLRNVLVGGGFVETFAFGGAAPAELQSGGASVTVGAPSLPFSLGDAMGISSMTPGFELAQRFAKLAGLVDPQRPYWPVTSSQFPKPVQAKSFEMGDGSSIENTGLLAMLQRGATKIAWFVNGVAPVAVPSGICKQPHGIPQNFNPDNMISDQVFDKFGFGELSRFEGKAEFIEHNQVFAKSQLIPVMCALQDLVDQGKPGVVKMTQKVLSNSWWGIKGGNDVDLVLVYNTKCSDFESALPKETRALLGKGDFKNYPYYKTGAGGLSAQQVNLLAAQAEYAVRQNEHLFKTLFA